MTEFVPSEKGVSIRYPSTALFPVNSADRYQNWDVRRQSQASGNSSPYDFTITKQTNLLTGFFTRISATEVTFPWTIPNVSTRLQTRFICVDVSGSGVNVTNFFLALGGTDELFLSAGELAVELEDTLNTDPDIGTSEGITWTVTFNTSGYYQIDASGAVFEMKPVPTIPNNYKQLYDMMGFSPRSELLGVQVSTFLADMLPIKYVDITSLNLTYCQDLKDSSTSPKPQDTICRLYLTPEEGVYPNKISYPDLSGNSQVLSRKNGFDMVNWGSRPFVIHRQFTLPKQIKWDNIQPIGQVRFQVYMDNGDIIPGSVYGYDSDWMLTLQVSEV